MGIQRRLPQSDESRLKALNAAKNKKDNTPPSKIVLTPNTITRLDSTQPDYAAKMLDRGKALQAQSTATEALEKAKAKTVMFISHFIQTFNNSVDRGVFAKSDRAFYQLDVNSNRVPDLKSEADILLWGNRLIDGDAQRVAAGGAAMGFPTIAEVTTVFNDFKNLDNAQSAKKDAYDDAQEAVSTLKEEVDKLILRMWDEVETAYNDEPITSKRRKSREWGVVYVSTTETVIEGTVTNFNDNTPLADADVLIVETDNSTKTDANGKYKLTTQAIDNVTVSVAKENFVRENITVNIPGGKNAPPIKQDVKLKPS